MMWRSVLRDKARLVGEIVGSSPVMVLQREREVLALLVSKLGDPSFTLPAGPGDFCNWTLHFSFICKVSEELFNIFVILVSLFFSLFYSFAGFVFRNFLTCTNKF